MNLSSPRTLDGASLPEALLVRLGLLAEAIRGVDPLRPEGEILCLAEAALRATAVRTRTGWISRRTFALDGGRGPSLRLR